MYIVNKMYADGQRTPYGRTQGGYCKVDVFQKGAEYSLSFSSSYRLPASICMSAGVLKRMTRHTEDNDRKKKYNVHTQSKMIHCKLNNKLEKARGTIIVTKTKSFKHIPVEKMPTSLPVRI